MTPSTTVTTTAAEGLQLPQGMVATNATQAEVTNTTLYKQPPGFKELRERISKFAGDGKEDFDIWLADYCEATGDCGWSDELRAR